MENFIITKEFTESELNVPQYDIDMVSKGKAANEKFKARVQFDYDQEHVVSALYNKAEIYIYKREGKILSMFIVRKVEDGFSCDECHYADSIRDSEDAALMDRQIAYLIAKKAMDYKVKAFFKGVELPKLTKTSSKFSWSMAVCFTIIYGLLFYTVLRIPTGILIGIPLGLCMGLCFTKYTYAYEGMVEKTSSDNSEE